MGRFGFGSKKKHEEPVEETPIVDDSSSDDDWDDDDSEDESLSVYDAAFIWMSNGKDEDYTFGYTEEESKQLYSPRTRGTALLTGLYGRHDYVDSPAGQRLYRAPIVGLKKFRLASR